MSGVLGGRRFRAPRCDRRFVGRGGGLHGVVVWVLTSLSGARTNSVLRLSVDTRFVSFTLGRSARLRTFRNRRLLVTLACLNMTPVRPIVGALGFDIVGSLPHQVNCAVHRGA